MFNRRMLFGALALLGCAPLVALFSPAVATPAVNELQSGVLEGYFPTVDGSLGLAVNHGVEACRKVLAERGVDETKGYFAWRPMRLGGDVEVSAHVIWDGQFDRRGRDGYLALPYWLRSS